ncbi:MAG TPA: hypothetical protein VGG17_09140 [Acidimicrobiales bacterium]|jgi:hypothetical protein
MTADYIENVLRSIDPASSDTDEAIRAHESEVWQSVSHSLEDVKPRRTHRYEIVGATGATVTAAAVLIVALVGTPTSAVAAALKAAATADASAAILPPLVAGQYYYQESQVSLTCAISSPNMPSGEAPLTYVSDGTMKSWTTASGIGEVMMTPSQVDVGGSHFATPKDEARWVALGEPFIPCALANSSNDLAGNPANANNGGAFGGYTSSMSGYGGFGLSLAFASDTTLLKSTTSVNNLPSNAAGLSALLANGEINTDGSLSATPQVCPNRTGAPSTSLGCTPNEQLDVLEQLIQLPDASAKLGSVLYQVLANLPGAQLVGPVISDGATDTAIEVPQSSNETFEVVLNPTSGALVSCSELVTQNGTTTSVGSVRYGPVQIAQGEGSTPATPGNS